MKSGRLAGQVAIVTGAASGIGAATAARLAEEGAFVAGVDVNEKGLWAQKCLEITFTEDLDDDEVPARIVEGTLMTFERLDILVNNAGIGGATRVAETSDQDWDRFMDIDLRTVFRMSRAVLPTMREAGGGRIINVSSVFGLIGFPGSAAYGVAKAGVAQLTRQMAADYGPDGITVNAVAPGVIETPMTVDRIRNNAWYQEQMIAGTPLGRVGQPADVAPVIAFLASADAAYVSGQVIAVDGGWSTTRYRPRPDD